VLIDERIYDVVNLGFIYSTISLVQMGHFYQIGVVYDLFMEGKIPSLASAKIDYGKEARDTFSLGEQSLRWTSWVFLLFGILEKLGFPLR